MDKEYTLMIWNTEAKKYVDVRTYDDADEAMDAAEKLDAEGELARVLNKSKGNGKGRAGVVYQSDEPTSVQYRNL